MLFHEFPTFYRRFITMFTTAYHQLLSWTTWTKVMLWHSVSLKLISIFFSHPCLYLPKWSLCFRFHHHNYVYISSVHTCLHPPHQPWLYRSISGVEYKIWSSSLHTFLQAPVTSTFLGSKYLPQHPVLEHPWPMFYPQVQNQIWNLYKARLLYILIFGFFNTF